MPFCNDHVNHLGSILKFSSDPLPLAGVLYCLHCDHLACPSVLHKNSSIRKWSTFHPIMGYCICIFFLNIMINLWEHVWWIEWRDSFQPPVDLVTRLGRNMWWTDGFQGNLGLRCFSRPPGHGRLKPSGFFMAFRLALHLVKPGFCHFFLSGATAEPPWRSGFLLHGAAGGWFDCLHRCHWTWAYVHFDALLWISRFGFGKLENWTPLDPLLLQNQVVLNDLWGPDSGDELVRG